MSGDGPLTQHNENIIESLGKGDLMARTSREIYLVIELSVSGNSKYLIIKEVATIDQTR